MTLIVIIVIGNKTNEPMKFIKTLCYLLLLFSIYSCGEKDKKSSEALNEILKEYTDSITYFDKECIHSFEKSFRKIGGLNEEDKLIEVCSFFPKKEVEIFSNLNVTRSDIFLAFYMKEDTIGKSQTYLYDKKFHVFIPVSLEEKQIKVDSVYVLQLHFDDKLNCGGNRIEGSMYSDSAHNGLFKRSEE